MEISLASVREQIRSDPIVCSPSPISGQQQLDSFSQGQNSAEQVKMSIWRFGVFIFSFSFDFVLFVLNFPYGITNIPFTLLSFFFFYVLPAVAILRAASLKCFSLWSLKHFFRKQVAWLFRQKAYSLFSSWSPDYKAFVYTELCISFSCSFVYF